MPSYSLSLSLPVSLPLLPLSLSLSLSLSRSLCMYIYIHVYLSGLVNSQVFGLGMAQFLITGGLLSLLSPLGQSFVPPALEDS